MVEIVKPEFVVGSEKRFSEFISGLNEKDKIALISHTDLDGIASAKVINRVIEADMLMLLGYEELTMNLVAELKKNKIKKVIFSDLNFTKPDIIKEIEKFAEILIIDHHIVETDFNSEKTVFLSAEGFCASYICYYLFSKIQNIEKIDWMVACASIADFLCYKNRVWMSEIYEKYEDKFVIENDMIRRSGKFYDSQYELSLLLIYFKDDLKRAYELIEDDFDISNIKKYTNFVQRDIEECAKRFEKEKIEIKDGYFWEFKSIYHIKAFLINDISVKHHNKTIIFGAQNGNVYSISIRRQDGKLDVRKLFQNLIKGFDNSGAGGHFKASGGYMQLKDREEFKKRVLAL